MTGTQAPLIAVDVGNSRVKLGRFDDVRASHGRLPTPAATLDLAEPAQFDRISAWLASRPADDFRWYIGSVQRAVSSTLIDWLREHGARQITLLASFDLPLRVSLPRPDMVGIDRLLGAVAVNHIRNSNSPAIVVDLGTAITVDLVEVDGAFAGGAILPGIGLSARALHEFTDLLPQLDMHALAEPPSALGTDTIAAMRAGIYWGAVGGVRQLIELLGRQLAGAPQVFLTGGAAPAVAHLIAADAGYQAHLVLSGIALAADTRP
jgi:type III pantothenate kinase